MTVAELLEHLKRAQVNPDEPVRLRNTAVPEETMEAGVYGYIDLEEVLVVDGAVYLLPESN